MTFEPRGPYHGAVEALRSGAPRWLAAGLVLLLAVMVARALTARAAAGYDVGDQAVVNLIVRGRANDIDVRMWDRPTVLVDSGDDTPTVTRRETTFGANRGLVLQVPAQLVPVRTPDGVTTAQGALPPEEFPYAGFRPGRHDVVAVDAPQGSRIVLTVPSTIGLLVVRVGGGRTIVENYHGANLVVIQNQGRVQITGAATTAFVQMNEGTLYAADDAFERVRVRGVGAHDIFERCRSREIQTTSVSGSIVYDGGSFDPGLARFESGSGEIALGVTSGAQLAGRAVEGHVYTQFNARTPVDQHGDGDATAFVDGGGPLVSAITERGNVYLYDGSLLGRRVTSPEWRQLHQLFATRRTASPPISRPRGESHVRERMIRP